MRTHLYASVGVLKIGNDILFKEEKIKVDRITAHGGLFKTRRGRISRRGSKKNIGCIKFTDFRNGNRR